MEARHTSTGNSYLDLRQKRAVPIEKKIKGSMMLIAARGLVGSWAKAQAIPATLVHVVQGILQPHRLPGAKPKRIYPLEM